ncbi:crinkly4 [Actinidia rufa]|uniref:non-specific serine/threonine protein kinase n=1 Tax=Actinidia rufa TaxID=165716 RepID=A0A7J0E850_9ERIC|nr:crinkly4 [Actinidia rufa]
MGVPQPMVNGSEYIEISAGDHHLCGLRKSLTGRGRNTSLVDCWGYNMTANHVFEGKIQSISAGSEFNCGLFSQNRTVFCWGDETSSRVISLIPKEVRSLSLEEEISVEDRSGQVNVNLAPNDPMLSIVGGRFHACGIKRFDHGVACWGYSVERSTPPPGGVRLYEIAAGDYFTCGILAEKSLLPVCWGAGFPSSLPLAVSPGLCKSDPCETDFYSFNNGTSDCKSPDSHICLPCSNSCPTEMYQKVGCTSTSDLLCEFNCSGCVSSKCLSKCSYSSAVYRNKNGRFWSLQLPVIVAEIAFVVFLVSVVSLTAIFYVRYKLKNCTCSARDLKSKRNNGNGSSFQKDSGKIQPDLDDVKIRRAQMFSYKELERATGGFKEESQVGKGSFSCVFKGVLKDETVVAVKRAIVSPDMKKNSKEFHTELDLLSRLNHAHLLNLIGYCEEGGERLLVYEFMANGSLHQHLHGKNKASKEQLDWVRRVTIAVQAAREGNIVEWAVPLIKAGDIQMILDPVLKPPSDVEALKRIANVACNPSNDQPILPTEVVLGSSRLHKKSSQRSSNRSVSETDVAETEDPRFEFRAPSWITFPSVTSSQRRKSLDSDADVDVKNTELRNGGSICDGLRSLEEEIGPASPQENLFLQHNF